MALILTAFFFLGSAAAEQEVKDHRVEVKIDKTLIIAPKGSGVERAMMSMARHPDGTIFLNAQNLLVKSSDSGKTWTKVPVKLPDVPADQTQIGMGITRSGRILMVHQNKGRVGNLYGQSLYVSYSDDGGKTWKKSPTDFGRIPPGLPNMQFHEDGVRTFIEQPDGTLMFTTTIVPSPDYGEAHGSRGSSRFKLPLKPPNYAYAGTPLDFFGDIVLRSYDGGETWGDPTRVYPALPPHESALAIDPHDGNHILLMSRMQTGPSWHSEKEQKELMKETGNPNPQYKNGALFESTDGSRTFQVAKGGFTPWYGHRGTISWSPSNVVVVTHNYGGSGDARKVARISLDGGKTWVDGTKSGTPLMNKSTKFVLAPGVGFTSPTIELSKNRFLTAMYRYPHLPVAEVPERFRDTVVGVFWHLERSVAKE